MNTFNKFNDFAAALGKKKHDFNNDALQMMLTNVLPTATMVQFSDLTEITAENGYTAGGVSVPVTSWSGTDGIAKLVNDDAEITASGGTIGPFRYAVLYNSSSTGGPLIGWFDYGSELTLQDGHILALDFDPDLGTLTLS